MSSRCTDCTSSRAPWESIRRHASKESPTSAKRGLANGYREGMRTAHPFAAWNGMAGSVRSAFLIELQGKLYRRMRGRYGRWRRRKSVAGDCGEGLSDGSEEYASDRCRESMSAYCEDSISNRYKERHIRLGKDSLSDCSACQAIPMHARKVLQIGCEEKALAAGCGASKKAFFYFFCA